MALCIISPNRDPKPWIQAFQKLAPDLDVRVWPDDQPREAVKFTLVWKHPKGIFSEFPNLKAICSMGAGVDHLFADPTLPESVPMARIVDENLLEDMWEHTLALVLSHLRRLEIYKDYQKKSHWEPVPYGSVRETHIGIMGLGQLGSGVAKKLAAFGFTVSGWSASEKNIPGVKSFVGDAELEDFLGTPDFLICLLPLTKATEGIMNKNLFRKVKKGGVVINLARGPLMKEEDLIPALDSKHLAHAYLDVFVKEPLPKDHPFWGHPKISITPHVASISDPTSVARQVVENYQRATTGKPLKNKVDFARGY